MKHTLATPFGLNLAFWRALLPEGAIETVPAPEWAVSVKLWWGIDVEVEVKEGDLLEVMPTPWGAFVEGVVRAKKGEDGLVDP